MIDSLRVAVARAMRPEEFSEAVAVHRQQAVNQPFCTPKEYARFGARNRSLSPVRQAAWIEVERLFDGGASRHFRASPLTLTQLGAGLAFSSTLWALSAGFVLFLRHFHH